MFNGHLTTFNIAVTGPSVIAEVTYPQLKVDQGGKSGKRVKFAG